MRTKLTAHNPDEIEFTLLITMTATAWQRFSEALNTEQLRGTTPVWQLRRDIDDLLTQAHRVYHPIKPSEETKS